MKGALIEIYTGKNLSRRIDAHYRNSCIIAEYLNFDLLVTEKDFINALNKKYDVLILGYASRYAPFRMIRQLIEKNSTARKIILSNEYNIKPSVGGFKPYDLIANYEGARQRAMNKYYQLNLNLLLARKSNDVVDKKYDCIYYGTFRVNRERYYKKYLKDELYLSATTKNYKKYKHIGCTSKFIKKLNWEKGKETLNLFKYSLYIEDDYTHDNFNNLANRWYEAGFCNNVVFFDKNCINTINKSEIAYFKNQIENYIVSSYEELQEKIKECNKDFSKHLAIQKCWRGAEPQLRKEMLEKLKNIIYAQN